MGVQELLTQFASQMTEMEDRVKRHNRTKDQDDWLLVKLSTKRVMSTLTKLKLSDDPFVRTLATEAMPTINHNGTQSEETRVLRQLGTTERKDGSNTSST